MENNDKTFQRQFKNTTKFYKCQAIFINIFVDKEKSPCDFNALRLTQELRARTLIHRHATKALADFNKQYLDFHQNLCLNKTMLSHLQHLLRNLIVANVCLLSDTTKPFISKLLVS